MAEAESIALSVAGAAAAYMDATARKLDPSARAEIARFVSWYGGERRIGAITAHELTQYAEAQSKSASGQSDRLNPLKALFMHAKKQGWTATNLGASLRVKKAARRRGEAVSALQQRRAMTADGLAAAQQELAELIAERPQIARTLELARADKDFRENAPLDAARDTQAHHEGRIRALEAQIAQADVVGGAAEGEARVGSNVILHNLVSGQTVEYTLVGQNEVDATGGKISVASPVGHAVVGHRAGEEVEVSAPSGVIRFRLESVEE